MEIHQSRSSNTYIYVVISVPEYGRARRTLSYIWYHEGLTKELYHLAYDIISRSSTELWKKEAPVLQAIERYMPSKKTASTEALENYIVYMLTHRKDIYQLHSQWFSSLRFW
ncbi:hypothetical protein DFQ28_008481, partial [Apophysomyces sp. BC1034]